VPSQEGDGRNKIQENQRWREGGLNVTRRDTAGDERNRRVNRRFFRMIDPAVVCLQVRQLSHQAAKKLAEPCTMPVEKHPEMRRETTELVLKIIVDTQCASEYAAEQTSRSNRGHPKHGQTRIFQLHPLHWAQLEGYLCVSASSH
jgi:hypothetical protein